jgi:hypothetical protein
MNVKAGRDRERTGGIGWGRPLRTRSCPTDGLLFVRVEVAADALQRVWMRLYNKEVKKAGREEHEGGVGGACG